MDAAIQKAQERTQYVSGDKEALRAYEMRQMALSDWTSAYNQAIREGRETGIQEGIQQGIQKGKKEGIQEGIQEGKRAGIQEGAEKKAAEIARHLKAIGTPLEQVAQITGLAEADLCNL